MTATARDRLRAMLADLKMPGALEAVDGVLAKVDSGAVTAGEAIEQVRGAQIALRNNRRLQAAMRSSRLPAVKTLAQFDFTFQPSLKREQIERLHELGFLDRRENVILLGPPGVGKTHGLWALKILRIISPSQCQPFYSADHAAFSRGKRISCRVNASGAACGDLAPLTAPGRSRDTFAYRAKAEEQFVSVATVKGGVFVKGGIAA